MKVWNTCLFKKKTRCWIQHHTTSTRATRFDALSQKVIVPMQISKILHDFQFYLRDYSNWQQCDWFFSNFQNSIQRLCAHTKSAQWIWKKTLNLCVRNFALNRIRYVGLCFIHLQPEMFGSGLVSFHLYHRS